MSKVYTIFILLFLLGCTKVEVQKSDIKYMTGVLIHKNYTAKHTDIEYGPYMDPWSLEIKTGFHPISHSEKYTVKIRYIINNEQHIKEFTNKLAIKIFDLAPGKELSIGYKEIKYIYNKGLKNESQKEYIELVDLNLLPEKT